MPSPYETVLALHSLPETERHARWQEGASAWEALGNPEQALRFARKGEDAREIARLGTLWEEAAGRQRARLEANARAAESRLAPPALPSLAWNEAKDLARGVTWIVRDGRTDLMDLGGPLPRLLPLDAPQEVEEDLKKLASASEPFLLGPMGNARLVGAALEAQRPIFLSMRAAIYVVEPSLGFFRMLARLFDLEKPLAADHVLWFVGDDWAGRLAAFLRAAPDIPLPRRRAIVNAGIPDAAMAGLIAETDLWRQNEERRLEAEAARLYALRTEADWRAAFAEGSALRVLLVTDRFTTVLQYVTRDLAQAFRALGCETAVAIQRRDCELFVTFQARQRVLSFKPDLVVQLDHLRPKFGRMYAEALPYACWIQDRLSDLFEKHWIAQLGARDLTFAMWPGIAQDCLDAGYPEVHLLPVAGNAFLYRPPESPLPPGPDVAFVSNISVPEPFAAYPGLVESAERILRAEGIGYRDPLFYDRLLARLERELGLRTAPSDRPALLHTLSFSVERYVQRTEPLRWARAMGLEVSVWGRGWEASPEFAPLARGVVAPGGPLRDLYAAARIHLHMNSDTNVHARVFECLLSGGFILAWAHPSDAQPGGLGKMLEIGREVEVFNGRPGFETQVRKYLGDAGARRAVSEAGRARCLQEHTSVHRAREILKRVRERLGA